MAKKFRHISIHRFSLFLALPILTLFGLVFWFVFRDLESIRTLAYATGREYLPRILAKQQLLINIENLRRSISLVYYSGDRLAARNAGITAQALIVESVFGESAEFSAVMERLKPDFRRLLELQTQLCDAEGRLHDQEIALSGALGRLVLRSGILPERIPAHWACLSPDSRSPQNRAQTYADMENALAPLIGFCADAAGTGNADLLADCRGFQESLHEVGQSQRFLIDVDAESKLLWEQIDSRLRELSDYASTSEAAQIVHSMNHIEEETSRIQRLFLAAGAMLLLALAGTIILIHRHILRPLAMTSRALDSIRSGRRVPPLPQARTLELQNILDILPALTVYMEELNARSGRLERERDQYADLSLRDALTGIGNRRALETVLASDMPGTPLGLLMLDLDLFKSYNDIFGHQQGDIALKAVAGAMKNAMLRSSDMAFRYGGEEFTALLLNADRAAALTVARRVMDSVRSLGLPHPSSPTGIITVSIGVACRMPGEKLSIQELLTLADQALYRSKKSGRNTITMSNGELEEKD